MKRRYSRVFQDEHQVNKNLICPICHDVFNQPVRSTCGHTFCKDCIKQWTKMKSTCPLCRKFIHQNFFQKDIIPHKMIQELTVRCPQTECDWQGSLESLSSHVKGCKKYQDSLSKEDPKNFEELSEPESQTSDQFQQMPFYNFPQNYYPPNMNGYPQAYPQQQQVYPQQQQLQPPQYSQMRFQIPIIQQMNPVWQSCIQYQGPPPPYRNFPNAYPNPNGGTVAPAPQNQQNVSNNGNNNPNFQRVSLQPHPQHQQSQLSNPLPNQQIQPQAVNGPQTQFSASMTQQSNMQQPQQQQQPPNQGFQSHPNYSGNQGYFPNGQSYPQFNMYYFQGPYSPYGFQVNPIIPQATAQSQQISQNIPPQAQPVQVLNNQVATAAQR